MILIFDLHRDCDCDYDGDCDDDCDGDDDKDCECGDEMVMNHNNNNHHHHSYGTRKSEDKIIRTTVKDRFITSLSRENHAPFQPTGGEVAILLVMRIKSARLLRMRGKPAANPMTS